jgi:excinuclease ABC subunit A
LKFWRCFRPEGVRNLELFAGSPEAKAAGLKKSAFSYLHKDGMCPDCKGMGQQKTALDFLGDIWTPCETCSGQRFQPKVLACVVNGLHIGNWLQLHVSEALERTKQQPKLHAVLAALSEVGLGHLLLGQSCKTLSGGEAQRLKLALELIHHRKGRNLYLFDEPSAGLHAQDVAHLLGLFEKMAADGHTILYIEHHPAMVAAANQVVVLGPDGGNAGGELLSDGLS